MQTLPEARSRLYQRKFVHQSDHVSGLLEIYNIFSISFYIDFSELLQNVLAVAFANFRKQFKHMRRNFEEFEGFPEELWQDNQISENMIFES